jgi:hypothetical protein
MFLHGPHERNRTEEIDVDIARFRQPSGKLLLVEIAGCMRFCSRPMQLAGIGATNAGGVCRLALTELDRQARELFIARVKEEGCSVRCAAPACATASRL